MARVNEMFLNQFGKMKIDELQNPVIFVVDMIEGFINEGALHDEKINDIVPCIEQVIHGREQRTIFIADAHPPKTREFLSYPTHCVIGTRESEIIEKLQPYIDEVFHKNSTNAFTSMQFQQFLKERLDTYQDIVITGCCSDICILQFALCLNAYLNEHNKVHHRVIVPIDCIDTYHIEGVHDCVPINEFSILNMQGNGIHVVRTLERGEA